ncbi:MAG: hypothetical protein U0610_30620 [bacterium]
MREPTLYVPLKEALTDAGLNDEATALSDSLGDFDDTELELQVSPEWFRTRRELDRYRDVLSSLVGALTSEVPDSDIQLEREVLDFLSARHVTGQLNTVTIGDLPASAQSEFKTLLSRYAAARIAVEGELRSRFGARRLDSFADLLNNEPQLIIRTSGRLRDRVAGPNEFVVEAKYELGFAHLSELLEDCSSGSAEFDWRSSKALDCYQKYVSDAGDRWIEESRVDRGQVPVRRFLSIPATVLERAGSPRRKRTSSTSRWRLGATLISGWVLTTRRGSKERWDTMSTLEHPSVRIASSAP